MTPTFISLILIALIAACAFTAIWSRRDTRGRALAMALFVIGVPTVAAASVEMLGHHKPQWAAWNLPAGDHLVLSAKMVQDVGIWLYLDLGTPEPFPLALPWSNEQAQAVQEAKDGAPEGMEGQFLISVGDGEDDGQEGEWVAHPIPQAPAPPAKPAPEAGMVYRPS